jgi:hypothetical protein
MSRTIPHVPVREDRQGLPIIDRPELLKGLAEKCPTCRYWAGGECIIAKPVLAGTAQRTPPQLRHTENGRPICSSFRHKDEENVGIKNAAKATPKLF